MFTILFGLASGYALILAFKKQYKKALLIFVLSLVVCGIGGMFSVLAKEKSKEKARQEYMNQY